MGLEDRIKDILQDLQKLTDSDLDEPLSMFEENELKPGYTKEKRMRLFIELYEKAKKHNTKNLLYIPMGIVPRPPLTDKAVARSDYRGFFMRAILDPIFISIPDLECGEILPSVADSSQNYIIVGDIYMDFISTPEFGRLYAIKQHGTIGKSILFNGLNISRNLHSLTTGVLTELVLRMNQFPEELINLGIVAGLFHDLGITPFSDQGKLAASEELNEENLLQRIITCSDQIRDLLAKHRINETDLINTIQGKGPLGELVNSKGIDVDKIAYVAQDYHSIKDYISEDFRRWLYISSPDLFHIHKDMVLKDKFLYFKDPKKVMSFLQLRAVLFSEVYLNKYNRAREAFFQRELPKFWKKELNVPNMTTLQDSEFETLISPKNKILANLFRYTMYHYCLETCRDYDISQYEAYAKHYNNESCAVLLHQGFSPGTQTSVSHQGIITPIRAIFPEKCGYIEQMSKNMAYIGVYDYYKKPRDIDTTGYYENLDKRLLEFTRHF